MKEVIQKIDSKYVSNECIQIGLPLTGNSISFFNGEEILYYYNKYTSEFKNKYVCDSRRYNFSYFYIPRHDERVGFKKFEYVNQLLEYGKIYIKITDQIAVEHFAIKDDYGAYLITKILEPFEKSDIMMNYDGIIQKFEDITVNKNTKFFNVYGHLIHNPIKNIEEAPSVACYSEMIQDSLIAVEFEDNNIKNMYLITVGFLPNYQYQVKTSVYDIVDYTIEFVKTFERDILVETKEPKIKKRDKYL